MSGPVIYLVGAGDEARAAQVARSVERELDEAHPGEFALPAVFAAPSPDGAGGTGGTDGAGGNRVFWVIVEARSADLDGPAEDAARRLAQAGELADRVDDIGWGRCLTDDLGSQYGRRPADTILAVAFAVPPEEIAELQKFYAQEHVPLLLGCPDWLRARLFATTSERGGAHNRLALHDLHGVGVFADPAVQRSRSAEGYERMGQRSWFTAWPRTLCPRIEAR